MENEPNQTEGIQTGDGFLTKTEVAKSLKITTRTLETWMSRGFIPFYKIGRTVRFKMKVVEEHLKHNCLVAGLGLN
jgi:excisionase family DNA binding protein